ncbi:MAG: hypothetical protein CMM59_11925 [Rhodospirillaceae bacterium]|nr:hypothetical protein [Rhodospirillaceae bacterium]
MPNESRTISNLWRIGRFKVSPGAPRTLYIRRGATAVVEKQMRNGLLLLAILILPFGVVPNAAHAADTSSERWRISKCFGATQATEKVVLRDAIGHCDIALATDQLSTFERARTYNNRCWILLTLHMPTDLALADCARAVDLDPELAEAYVNRARALMKQGLFDAAKADILRSLQLVPDSRTALINLGALQLRMDNFEAAMKAFDRAFALNPQSAAAYNNRGSLYLQTGDYKMALRDFDMAIAMQDDFAPAMFNRGIVFLRQGNYQAARRAFSKAARFGRQDGRAFLFRGFAHDALEERDRALKDFNRAYQLGVRSRWLLGRLGRES